MSKGIIEPVSTCIPLYSSVYIYVYIATCAFCMGCPIYFFSHWPFPALPCRQLCPTATAAARTARPERNVAAAAVDSHSSHPRFIWGWQSRLCVSSVRLGLYDS